MPIDLSGATIQEARRDPSEMESGALAAQRAWRAAAEMRAFNDDSGSEISQEVATQAAREISVQTSIEPRTEK